MAALSNHRMAWLNGTTAGWAAPCLRQYNGSLYWCLLDAGTNKLRMYKGSGNGTWTELDAANAPTHTSATASYAMRHPLSGSFTHLSFIIRFSAANTMRIRRFNHSLDQWETTDAPNLDIATTGDPTFGVDLGVRPDGDIVALWKHNSTGDVMWSAYAGSSWSTAAAINTTQTQHVLSAVMTGNSDLFHTYTFVNTANDFQHASISNADVRGTVTQPEATISQMFSSFGSYVLDGATHRIAIWLRDSDGSGELAYTASSSSPSWSFVTAATPTTTTDPGIMGGVVVPYNNQYVIVWSGDARGEIHKDTSDDYATPALGTDSTIVSGLSANDPGLFAIPATTGVPVVYTNHAATPSSDIVWAAGAPPAAAAPNHQMIWWGG